MSALDVVETETESGHHAGDRRRPNRRTPTAGAGSGSSSGRRSRGWLLVLASRSSPNVLPLKDPEATFRGVSRDGPGSAHWFGADNIGHDVFSPARSSAPAARSPVRVRSPRRSASIVGGADRAHRRLLPADARRRPDGRAQHPAGHPRPRAAADAGPFLAPPGEASPSKQTFWATIGPVDPRPCRRSPASPGPRRWCGAIATS